MTQPVRISDRVLAARMIMTMALLVLLYAAAVMVAVVFVVQGRHWGTAVLAAVLVVAGAATIAGQRRATRRRLLHELRAKEVTPDDEPVLHGMLDRLGALAAIAKPRIFVAETAVPNGFAIGDELCVTRGLLDRLEPNELEAVLAHELGHLAHRDGTVLEYAAAPGLVCGAYLRFGVFALFGQPVYWLSTLLVLMLSRAREFSADRAAAILTGRPSDLAAALVKLSDGAAQIPAKDLRAIEPYHAMLCVELRDVEGGRISAHPPLGKRLGRLSAISAQLSKGA